MSKITFGRIIGIQNDNGYWLHIPFETGRDWRGVLAGQDALEDALEAVKTACVPHLPKVPGQEAVIDWVTDDKAILRIPCHNRAEGSTLQGLLRTKISALTGAPEGSTHAFPL